MREAHRYMIESIVRTDISTRPHSIYDPDVLHRYPKTFSGVDDQEGVEYRRYYNEIYNKEGDV